MAKLTPTILEGDIESDIEYAILNLCFINHTKYHKNASVFTRNILEEHFAEVLSYVDNHPHKHVALLILGYFILLTGLKVDYNIIKSIIKACNWIYEENNWGWEYKLERRFYLNDLKNKLSQYKSGSRTYLVSLKNINNEDLLNGIIGINQLKESIKSGKIFKVKHINLDSCGLSKIPSIIFKLTHINSLSLDHNRIKKVPCSITKLKSLRSLYLEGNLINSLPECFQDMHSLKVLVLSNNNFSDPPRVTSLMKSLDDVIL